jgi:hypothetical protein
MYYFPNFLDSPNLEGQVPLFISPRNRVAQLYPRALGSLSVASYDSQETTFLIKLLRPYFQENRCAFLSGPIAKFKYSWKRIAYFDWMLINYKCNGHK